MKEQNNNNQKTRRSHIREPIISVLGHVDHGKTTLLDWIRGSAVASRESGHITQHIGATDVPMEIINKICGGLTAGKFKLGLDGLLFIDTPGHEAFTNLRKRGGSVSDIAILVVDINEGFMPQTIEAVEILKSYKTPFVVAANKIDKIHGWNKNDSLKKQQDHVRAKYDEKFWNLVSDLSKQGFNSDLYSNFGAGDFAKKIAIVPISAKTGTGISELLTILMGLAQQYLQKKLTIDYGMPAKGTILEVKEEQGLGATLDVILYDGHLKKGDKIVLGAKGDPIITKIKAILRPKPLDEMMDPRQKFSNTNEVYASCGIKLIATGVEKALSGAPVYACGKDMDENSIADEIRKEIGEIEISSDRVGVIVKADALGSLEAIVNILSRNEIPIRRGSVGNVSKNDIAEAIAVKNNDKNFGVILAFNTTVLKDAKISAKDNDIIIFKSDIIYRLLDDYTEWHDREKKIMFEQSSTVTPAKIRLLPKCVFRHSEPAIVGVEILAGTVKPGCRLMREDAKVVGKVRGMQEKKEGIKSANKGQQVAMSIDGITIGKHLNEGDVVYPFISNEDMDNLIIDELTDDEKDALREIRRIKRGM
ncbi:MAG: translation initiation factor IF-2 [Candidatus Altiarchaeales archaeon HGW-Altiarchaeales-3]|nr:MAG: translation initiation factor IF-2 [Candidatus Altiarchaeales archaeon HGW-Altiarchaeales-3]